MIKLILLLLFISILLMLLMVHLYLRYSFTKCNSNVCMNGKVVIVTGANSGIGFHAAKNLAKRGARVILACRSEERGAAARDCIVTLTGNHDVVFRKLDLSSLKSVREFAANIQETEHQLHVLVNNAGIYNFHGYTEDGILERMQVNCFGHFLLTLLLLPLLKKSQPSRIINLSSILHFCGGFDPETINKIRRLKAWCSYCNSKLCMLMFSVELSRRLAGTGVVANAVHPGAIKTNISARSNNIALQIVFWLCCLISSRSADQGAQTVEYLAVAEECVNVSGKYFVDCVSRPMFWKVRNELKVKQLWEYSEKIVGYRDYEEKIVECITKL